MFKHLAVLIASVALLFTGQSVAAASGVDSYRIITLEGTLLRFSPHSGVHCGDEYVHQVAKYRVDRVLDGKYLNKEIVVDHPACSGDVFKHIAVGSRVKLTVRVRREYGVITMHPGIREVERPKIFYVAAVSPAKM